MRHDPSNFKQWLAMQKEDGTPVPTRFLEKIVCPCCDGNGRYVNPSIDGNGITSSEMDELGDDFREDYMSGVYDVLCDECGGANVVDRLVDSCPPELSDSWDNYWLAEMDYRAECAAERRMGA